MGRKYVPKASSDHQRCSHTIAAPKLAFALSQAGTSRSGGAASNLTGELVGHTLASGELETHIRTTLLPAYAKRWRVMSEAIQTDLAPLGVKVPYVHTRIGDLYDGENNQKNPLKRGQENELVAGGYFIYIQLPEGISAGQLAQRSQAEVNLIVAPESVCRVPKRDGTAQDTGPEHDEFVRLCFAWEDEEVLVEGVKRLAKVLESMIKGVKSFNGVGETGKSQDTTNQFS
jgi:hypothetical protein